MSVGWKKLFVSAALICSVFCVADDLWLNDGRIYRDYEIKAVAGYKVKIAFINAQNKIETVVLHWSELPFDVRKKYTGNVKRSLQPEYSLLDSWTNLGELLIEKLESIPPDDQNKRSRVAANMRHLITYKMEQLGEEVDLQFVAADKNGALLKVVGTRRGSELRSGNYLYVYGCNRRGAFTLQLYPTGEKQKHSKYGDILIYGATAELASELVLDFLGEYAGDSSLFAPANTNANANTSSETPLVIINNYYADDEDDDEYIYVRRRRPPRPRPDPPHRPDQPPQPPRPQDPGAKPPAVPPVRPSGNNRVPDGIFDRPTVVRNNGHSGNYGLLPRDLIPGADNSTGKK